MNTVAVMDPELRAGWDAEREAQMISLRDRIKDLIDMHDRYGDSLQKSYLWQAYHRLNDGIGWFKWARERKAASVPTVGEKS